MSSMLKAVPEQASKPRPLHKWPYVANRHRKAAISEAKEVLNQIDTDFMDLLDEEIRDDLQEAIMCLRHNPTKALNHLRLVLRSMNTLVRSTELMRKRAETIINVLESAPATEDEDGQG